VVRNDSVFCVLYSAFFHRHFFSCAPSAIAQS
jgi:hypothetical protein